ncbi:MAG TPA: hypothetical protein PKE66_13355 [Pyrinomonadaceae bacterium]|nr:hypothetical protein [Pyrinomonadaceae bacterium]
MRQLLFKLTMFGYLLIFAFGNGHGQEQCSILQWRADLERWNSESIDESKDGSVIFGQDRRTGDIKFWESETGGLISVIRPENDVFALGDRIVVNSNGRILGTRLKNRKTFWIGDSLSGRRLTQFSTTPFEGSHKTYISPNGRTVLVGDYEHGASLWDAKSGRFIGRLRDRRIIDSRGQPFPFLRASFSPDSQIVATAYWGGVFLWNVRDAGLVTHLVTNKTSVRGLFDKSSFVYDIAFSPDGRKLAAGGKDGRTRLWDVSTGEMIATLEQKNRVFRAVFSLDGKYLATVSYDNKEVKIWEVNSGRLVHTIKSVGARPWTVTFGNPETGLLSVVVDDGVEFRNVTTGALVQKCRKLFGYFLSDGRTFLVGSRPNSIGLYRIASNPVDGAREAR